MIPLTSTSYPFLAIAQYFKVDYGLVLELAEKYARMGQPGLWALPGDEVLWNRLNDACDQNFTALSDLAHMVRIRVRDERRRQEEVNKCR